MDFKNQAMTLENVGNTETIVFPEIRSAVVSNPVLQEFGVNAQGEMPTQGPIGAIEPEYFVFALNSSDYLHGFVSAATAIEKYCRVEKGTSTKRKK